jgi:hypothetical protein
MRRFHNPFLLPAVLAGIFLACSLAHAQSDEFRAPKKLRDESAAARAEPFKGITADGKVAPGLFKIVHTGVTTEPVRKAAEHYLAALNEEQRKKTLFPVDSPEWMTWDNRHFAMREGVGLFDMTAAQRKLAFDLMRASLSAKGLKQTRDIMKLNGTLAELTKNYDEYSEWFYWITIMGTPSSTEPWGWQLDGHHAIINYFVLGNQVVMSPVFLGSEPVQTDSGKFKGTVVLQEEQNKGLALMRSLDKAQQAKATLAGDKKGEDTLTAAYRDNVVLDYAGIRASELKAAQKKLLLQVIAQYVSNMDNGHARVKLSEVRRHLDNTYFAWIGSAEPDGVFYYRIHSPVILIEFDHQRPIALAKSETPTRNHIHTVVRTPNGNDYGKDLLRQHHAQHPHGPAK